MSTPIRFAAALVFPGILAAQVFAQTSPAPAPAQVQAPAPGANAPQAGANPSQTPAQAMWQAQHPKRQSIVHHYPYPYPGAYHGDESGGWRNPGGSGRFIEYYPPGNQFQVNPQQDPVKVATFGGGGIPDRNEQLAAQAVGISRYNSIQGHIDNMARPSFGFGSFGGAY
jgi:hypothetical protein